MTEALQGILKHGKGVTAALFERNGIHVFNEKEIEKAVKFIGCYAKDL